jgi:hypothetical protein
LNAVGTGGDDGIQGTGQTTKPECEYQPPVGRKNIMSTYTVLVTKLPCVWQLMETTNPLLLQPSIERANKLTGPLVVSPGFAGVLISVLKGCWKNGMAVGRDNEL